MLVVTLSFAGELTDKAAPNYAKKKDFDDYQGQAAKNRLP
jgi:hypothetical protein